MQRATVCDALGSIFKWVLWEGATGELAWALTALLQMNGFLMDSYSWQTQFCPELFREGKPHFLILIHSHVCEHECVSLSCTTGWSVLSACVCQSAACVTASLHVFLHVLVAYLCFVYNILSHFQLSVCMHFCVNAYQNMHLFMCIQVCADTDTSASLTSLEGQWPVNELNVVWTSSFLDRCNMIHHSGIFRSSSLA